MAKYLTIQQPSEGMIREKMSRFLAFAFPVKTADEAKEKIAELTNRYHDARHVCWAYTIGADRSTWQLSDNGEPSGTAGKPILGQINSLSLTDIVVIVVRYFGGIKLGTPGLIAAYRAASREALDAATIIEKKEMTTIEITFPYLAMNNVMKIVKQPGIEIISQQFDNTCTMKLSLPLDDEPKTSRQLQTAITGI